jgi:hypothetical protein
MNGSIMRRGIDSQGISRGVKNKDVFPAAYWDVFTAARELPCEAMPPGLDCARVRE